MAYPNQSSIQAEAQTLQVAQIDVYAYAAYYGFLPSDQQALNNFISQSINPWASLLNVDPSYVMAYVQQYGSFPQTGQFQQWLIAAGYATQNGQLTPQPVVPGAGYPPGGGPTAPASSTNTGQTPASTDILATPSPANTQFVPPVIPTFGAFGNPLDGIQSLFQQNQNLILIGGAVFVAYKLFGGRRLL